MDESNPKLKKLEQILSLVDTDFVNQEELVELLQAITRSLNEADEALSKQVKSLENEVDSNKEGFNEALSQESSLIREQLSLLRQTIDKVKLQKGEKGDKGDSVKGEKGDQGDKGEDGNIKDLSPEEVRDSLELLKGDERLDISAIKGIKKSHTKLSDDLINRAISIVDNRTSFLINKVNELQTQINNFSGGGGGSFAIEEPTGVVDGSNTVFTVTNTPKAIVVDGLMKFETLAYTYVAPTITITDGVAPWANIRSLY